MGGGSTGLRSSGKTRGSVFLRCQLCPVKALPFSFAGGPGKAFALSGPWRTIRVYASLRGRIVSKEGGEAGASQSVVESQPYLVSLRSFSDCSSSARFEAFINI